MRNVVPLCVPGGILSTTLFPPIVLTFTFEPRIACATLIGTSQARSSPSRVKKRSGSTWNLMMRSPAVPPPGPRSPLPEMRTREPLSTPAGTLTLSLRRVFTWPRPEQLEHGVSGTIPRRIHTGHGRVTENPPCPNVTSPLPSHSAQRTSDVPGAAPSPSHVAHSSLIGTVTATRPPRAAVRSGTVTRYSTLRPRFGPSFSAFGFFPKSKMEEKMPPIPPRSDRSSNLKLPALPGAPPGWPGPNAPRPPYFRTRSYFLRLSGSERTPCASDTSLNFSVDFGSPAFASGWCSFASLR